MRSGPRVASFSRIIALFTSAGARHAVLGSSERIALHNASWKLRPIAITSPTDFICVVSVESAPGNFSNCHFGIFATT